MVISNSLELGVIAFHNIFHTWISLLKFNLNAFVSQIHVGLFLKGILSVTHWHSRLPAGHYGVQSCGLSLPLRMQMQQHTRNSSVRVFHYASKPLNWVLACCQIDFNWTRSPSKVNILNKARSRAYSLFLSINGAQQVPYIGMSFDKHLSRLLGSKTCFGLGRWARTLTAAARRKLE
jgi:hypothetical protein